MNILSILPRGPLEQLPLAGLGIWRVKKKAYSDKMALRGRCRACGSACPKTAPEQYQLCPACRRKGIKLD